MSKKLTIYIGEPLERLLAERQSETLQPTTLINVVADRYREIIRRNLPDLTLEEWSLVIDAMNGVITWDSAAMLGYAWAGIEDAIALDGLAAKWDVDGPVLIQKLHDLLYVESVALVDVVERFWSHFSGKSIDMAEVLQQLGVKPEEPVESPPSEDADPEYYQGANRGE
jgi:hypothetical protein